jgi:hypothetical protein
MKCHNNHSRSVVAVGAWWLSNLAVGARALHCVRAAHRDERDGFIYAAAMEWRHAAELFDWNTSAADYFWRRWERIMQLPRRLAGPISDSRTVALQPTSAM